MDIKGTLWALAIVLLLVAWLLSGCGGRMDRWREYRDQRRDHRDERWDQWREDRQEQRDGRWWNREKKRWWNRDEESEPKSVI